MCGYRIELHYVGVDSVDIAKKGLHRGWQMADMESRIKM